MCYIEVADFKKDVRYNWDDEPAGEKDGGNGT
jgi:hypothetical protein